MTEVSGELISQSFSRKHESEADDVGWDYLVAANVNPHGMIDMFKKLNEGEFPEPGALEAFSSHPALQKRIRHLEERWEKLPGKTDFLVLTNSLSGLTNAAGDKSPEKLFKRR
jgi:predicted Zn-dependent protease